MRNRNAVPPDRRRPNLTAAPAHRFGSDYPIPEHKMKLGVPIRFPVVPADHESLVGLIARATAEHWLLDLNRVLRRAGINMMQPGNLSRVDGRLLTGLAPILRCDPDQLLAAATPRISSTRASSAIDFAGTAVLPHDLELRQRRISPISVAAGSHHRQAWLLRILPYCSKSHEQLRSDCSECGATLRWRKSLGIGTCETCEREVRPTAADLLPHELRSDYSLFADLVCGSPAERGAASARLPEGIRELDGETLIDMVVKLGTLVHTASRASHRKQLYRLPPETIARIVAEGTAMLLDWPRRLRDKVAEESDRLAADFAALRRLKARLRRLGNGRCGRGAFANLLREALEHVHVDLGCIIREAAAAAREDADDAVPGGVQPIFWPSRRRPRKTLIRSEAAEALGISERLVELVDRRLIDAEVVQAGANRHIRLPKGAVDDLRKRKDGSISVPLLSRTAGLPGYAIESLLQSGLLEREADPALRYLRHGDSVTSASIAMLHASLTDGTGAAGNPRSTLAPSEAVPLGTAARRIGGRLKPWTAMLNAIAGGDLEAWLDPDPIKARMWPRGLLVRPSDMAAFDGVAVASSEVQLEECSLCDAREILNLDGSPYVNLRDVFADDIAARAQRGNRVVIGMTAVLAKATAEIAVAEICARTGWHHYQVRWVLRPFSENVTACGWLRRPIEGSGVLGEAIDWERRSHRRAESIHGPRTLGSPANGPS